MQNYVEFYFPGMSCLGQNERKVDSRNVAAIGSIPQNAIKFRFFEKESEDSEEKLNYSAYHYVGTEYSFEEFQQKYPQLAGDYKDAKRIVKTSTTGGFYKLDEEDIVVNA